MTVVWIWTVNYRVSCRWDLWITMKSHLLTYWMALMQVAEERPIVFWNAAPFIFSSLQRANSSWVARMKVPVFPVLLCSCLCSAALVGVTTTWHVDSVISLWLMDGLDSPAFPVTDAAFVAKQGSKATFSTCSRWVSIPSVTQLETGREKHLESPELGHDHPTRILFLTSARK